MLYAKRVTCYVKVPHARYTKVILLYLFTAFQIAEIIDDWTWTVYPTAISDSYRNLRMFIYFLILCMYLYDSIHWALYV